MRKLFILAPVLAALPFFVGALWMSAHNNTNLHNAPLAVSVAGALPGAKISYTTLTNEGESDAKTTMADQAGAATLQTGQDEIESLPAALDLEIESAGGNPIKLLVKIDSKTGEISIEGRGAKKFSDVAIAIGGKTVETRADWSGLFRELDATGLDKVRGSDGLKIAMFDNDIISDASQSPLMIDVYFAPGGGGPGSSQVNRYFNVWCGDPELSVCEYGLDDINASIVENYVQAFMLMGEQLSAVMLQQVAVIGTFLDAKQQLEVQRDLQSLKAEAHKDYQPSDQMCRFGSMMRSVTAADIRATQHKQALNQILMATYTDVFGSNSFNGYISELESRLNQFRKVYCDPMDNNGGLKFLCQENPIDGKIISGERYGGSDPGRYNKDIDYALTLAAPLTLDVDFLYPALSHAEEDIIALAKNLYWTRSFDIAGPPEALPRDPRPYMDMRRYMAINNVAHSSFTNLVGLKASYVPGTPPDQSGPSYMKALLREFGLPDDEIEALLGISPSYYAQMEILTKKIYQDPDFYTNLYDKPVNVDRIGVSMDAIKLMQNRDTYDISLRREMLLSMMVQEALHKPGRALSDKITNVIKSVQTSSP